MADTLQSVSTVESVILKVTLVSDSFLGSGPGETDTGIKNKFKSGLQMNKPYITTDSLMHAFKDTAHTCTYN